MKRLIFFQIFFIRILRPAMCQCQQFWGLFQKWYILMNEKLSKLGLFTTGNKHNGSHSLDTVSSETYPFGSLLFKKAFESCKETLRVGFLCVFFAVFYIYRFWIKSEAVLLIPEHYLATCLVQMFIPSVRTKLLFAGEMISEEHLVLRHKLFN